MSTDLEDSSIAVDSLLRGRIYNRTKKQGQRTDTLSDKLSGSQTAEKLATDYGVTSRTIERDGQFALAVEEVKKADPTATAS